MTAEYKKQDLHVNILPSYIDASGVMRSIEETTLAGKACFKDTFI